MVLLSCSDAELVAACLAQAGVCRRCCTRFQGQRASSAYLVQEREEREKQIRPNPCTVCLGTLQDCVMVPLLDSVVETITNSGYDSHTFSLSLSLPLCQALRQRSALVHLRDRLPGSALAGLDIEHIVPIKQVWKYIYPDVVAARVSLKHQTGENADFFAELQLDWEGDAEELKCLETLCRAEYATRTKNIHVYNMGVYSRMGVEKSVAGLEDCEFRSEYPVPPIVPSPGLTCVTKLLRESCWLAGRYTKYTRDLPQTPWLVEGVRRCETSLEEVLGEGLGPAVGASDLKFLASGREDVDVRMLGTGRPFALECCNPRITRFTAAQLTELAVRASQIHPGVGVSSLQMVSKKDIKRLKQGEEEKRKRYTALCVSKERLPQERLDSLAGMKDLALQQQTPIRVLHRRSDATRHKVVHSMAATRAEGNMFTLSITTSAGTYVKEFVHGDFSRTVPSLGSILGCSTDILALDVEEVMLEWPPPLS